ncbi:phosphate uptake regulator PhoU [Candidatus Woesearchaeota archaeon]|nr:phosphate uptake regulator PhoU [Candidatus Woesearchaeota archaeon]
MEVRKIVSFGNSSFVVTLPKSWVQSNGLKKGDIVRIEERPFELIIGIKDESKKAPSEAIINCENKSLNELKTEIMASYIRNYSVIRLTGSNIKNLSSSLKPIFHSLVGMEVIEETSSSIIVKDLMDISEVSIDNTLRRMDMLIKSMLDDSTKEENIESIYERDREVNRLALLALRIFRAATDNPGALKMFNTTYWDLFISRQVTVQLEHVGDNIKRISKLLTMKSNDDLKKAFMHLSGRYRDAMKIYYKKDKQSSYKVEAETKKYIQTLDKLNKRKDTTTASIIDNYKQMAKAIMYILRNVMEHD